MARNPARCRDLSSGGNQNVEVGCYFSRYRFDRGIVWLHRNRVGRGRHRQVSILSLPRDMPDFLRHRHIGRKESDVAGDRIPTTALFGSAITLRKLFSLPGLPTREDIFFAQLALVAHERERQHVAIAIEFVGGCFLARSWSFAVHFLNRHRVAGDRVFAPDADSIAVIERHLEGPIGFERPDCAE